MIDDTTSTVAEDTEDVEETASDAPAEKETPAEETSE